MVVVVDDDSEIRESLESLLSSAELGAVTFSSAESALASGLIAGASCLVTDVRMPGMPGTELQKRLRRDHPTLPIIMITAHPDEDMRRSVLSNGVAFLFYKPFNPIDLLQAIHSVIPGGEKSI
jgi:FixJ family two-component response regulator